MGTTAPMLPGVGNSGAGHWQSLWEAAHPSFRRVPQEDWDRPSRQAWVAALEGAVAEAGRDVVLVAHSLGCLLVAHWARYPTHPVRRALLVAVPAEQCAQAWGSRVVRIGTAGHINAASQLGDWPEGFALLEPLTGRPDTP